MPELAFCLIVNDYTNDILCQWTLPHSQWLMVNNGMRVKQNYSDQWIDGSPSPLFQQSINIDNEIQ